MSADPSLGDFLEAAGCALAPWQRLIVDQLDAAHRQGVSLIIPPVRLDGDDWPEQLGAALGAAARRSQLYGAAFVDVVVPIEPRSADMADQAEAERAPDARR